MTLEMNGNDVEILKKIDRLNAKSKAELMARLQRKTSADVKIWYCSRGRSCDGEPHTGVPYMHARSDQWPPAGVSWDTWFYMAGRGCIAGESLIELADGRKVRVDELAAAGEPVEVRTLYGSAWTDGAPFLKGVADLYRVTLQDGSTATVTDQHRFLTADGWRQLADLRVGQPIASARLESSSPSPSPAACYAHCASTSGAPRSMGRLGGSRRGCPTCQSCGDRRPLSRGEVAPESSLRSGDAGGHTPSWLPAGAPGNGRGCTPACPPLRHRARMRSAWNALFRAISGDRARQDGLESPRPRTPVPPRSLRTTSAERGVPAVHPRESVPDGRLTGVPASAELSSPVGAEPHLPPAAVALSSSRGFRSPSTTLEESSPHVRTDDASALVPLVPSWSEIVSVEFVRTDVFFDMTVPDGEHYSADGVWGHNSGKTKAGGNWARKMSRVAPRIALIGRRGTDVRATMIEGPAGLIKACEAAGETYDWKPALKEFTFENGAKAIGYSGEEPESLRGPEHAAGWLDEPCVAEGELVLLRRGLVPIEQVQVGDEAWTRLGWKRVSAVHDNGVKETYWVHGGGRRVRVTANHRLATNGDEWLRCEQLSHGSTLVACSHMALPHGSSGADVATTATGRGTTATAGGGFSIVTSMKRRKARSRKASWSTTSTKTRRTTTRRTLPLSQKPGTTGSLRPPSPLAESTSSRIRTLPSGAHGAGQRWMRSGTSENPALTLASGAESSSRAELLMPHTAAFPTEIVRVGSVSRAGLARVYDLTVDDAHEFVAGGLVVHNCHIDLIDEVWSNYSLGLRAMGVPGGAKTLLTSSPLPVKWTKDRIAEKGQLLTDELDNPILDEEGQPQYAPTTVLVSVPTSVNLKNLDEGYKRRVINPLRGTRKGKQELDAMLLEDVEGALWEADWLQRKRVKREDFDRIVVSIDPSGSDSTSSDLAGIVVAGKIGDEYIVLADESDTLSPAAWAKRAIELYEKYEADAIVLERYGGDSATTILRNIEVRGEKFTGKIVQVKARVGKATRAEPISALYEQKTVWHLTGANLADLEDEMLTWVPAITKKSPDRVDALVWALTDLSGKTRAKAAIGRARGTLRREPQNRAPGSDYARKNWNR